MEPILAFTDASFSSKYHVAVIGFRLHYDPYVHTQLINANDEIEAEIAAIEMCLEFLSTQHPGHPVILHSDNWDAIDYILTYYGVASYVTIVKIKGHTKGYQRDQLDRYMKSVDCWVRHQLREYLRIHLN